MSVSGGSDAGWSSQPNSSPNATRDNLLSEAGVIQQKNINIDGGVGTYTKNIFQFNGAIEAEIFGEIQNALAANITTAFLLLTDGTNEIPLTENIVGATLSSLPQGSWLGKIATASTAMATMNSSRVRMNENSLASLLQKFTALQKAGTNTYISLRYTVGAGTASGSINFFCKYRARSQQGGVFSAP